MHTHIIVNHDVGLILVVEAEEDIEATDILEELIVNELSNATAGIQET